MGVQKLRMRNPSLPAVHAVCWGCQGRIEALEGMSLRRLSRIRPCCRCEVPGAGYGAVPAQVDIGCTRRHRRV